jgi:hypothetical protein
VPRIFSKFLPKITIKDANKNKEKNMKNSKKHEKIPDLMFQNVKIPEPLAPTPTNPAIDEANQINIPRNPGPALNGLDWAIPDEPLVTDHRVHATPNPHTSPKKKKKK